MNERNNDGRSGERKRGRPWAYAAVVLLIVGGGGAGVAAWSSRWDDSAPEPEPEPEPEPTFDTQVERGAYLFERSGCHACHGQEGRGGVANENYVGVTVPALDVIAERLMLFEPEDAEIAIHLLEEGRDLPTLTGEPPFPGYARFLAQYAAIRGVMENGSPAGKLDPNGPLPPLQMPSWRDQLDSDAMDAILAYLLSLYPWDEEDLEDTEIGDPEAGGAAGAEGVADPPVVDEARPSGEAV